MWRFASYLVGTGIGVGIVWMTNEILCNIEIHEPEDLSVWRIVFFLGSLFFLCYVFWTEIRPEDYIKRYFCSFLPLVGGAMLLGLTYNLAHWLLR